MLLGMRTLLVLFSSIFFAFPSSACLWDRDTLRDEQKLQPDIYDLLTGRIPHHGDAYYEARVKRLTAKDGLSASEKNDLAVALVRLKQFDPAREILAELLKRNAEDYFTLSNLGVLEKKRGNYSVAADYIRKALAIKPEGHMGLGDWYLKQLEYRAELETNASNVPEHDFLGERYKESFRPAFMEAHRPSVGGATGGNSKLNFLKRLIQNDNTFPDGYLVFGDYLANTGQLNLAFIAYTRAIDLGHRNPNEIRRRRRALLKHFEQYVDKKRLLNQWHRSKWWTAKIEEARREIQEGADWLRDYQELEAEMVKNDGDVVSFDDVLKRLE